MHFKTAFLAARTGICIRCSQVSRPRKTFVPVFCTWSLHRPNKAFGTTLCSPYRGLTFGFYPEQNNSGKEASSDFYKLADNSKVRSQYSKVTSYY